MEPTTLEETKEKKSIKVDTEIDTNEIDNIEILDNQLPTNEVSNYTFDINRPWLTLDNWQKDYITTKPEKDCFLLCGRQVGKTTGMSIKAVELCVKHFKKGDYVLICSITEKQAYHMLAKALNYAKECYPRELVLKGKDKPTKHIINFKNGSGILCYAAGESGQGLRGFTIKKLMIDEGSRMSDEFFIAVSPMLSVIRGSMDIASTPCGKIGFYYRCSLDTKFKQFYVSAENCPRHTKQFLKTEKERLSKLAYAQEYLAIFTDELKRLIEDNLILRACTLQRQTKTHLIQQRPRKLFLGVDVAGFGDDETTFSILEQIKEGNKDLIEQVEQIIEKRNYTTQTTETILRINNEFNKIKAIGVDDGGVGFGVYSELMNNPKTKFKTTALNNASRPTDEEGKKSKKLLKEEMYINLLVSLEQDTIKLLDDEEIKLSLRSIQFEVELKEGKPPKTIIFGNYTHIAEGIIRALWLAKKQKSLNLFATYSNHTGYNSYGT